MIPLNRNYQSHTSWENSEKSLIRAFQMGCVCTITPHALGLVMVNDPPHSALVMCVV